MSDQLFKMMRDQRPTRPSISAKSRTGRGTMGIVCLALLALGACAEPLVKDIGNGWWARESHLSKWDFADVAKACKVGPEAWEVSANLEVQKFASDCMYSHGFIYIKR